MDDYILWSKVIAPLIIMIFIIYVIISANREYKKIERKKSEAKNQDDVSVNREDAFPPFLENFSAELESVSDVEQTDKTETALVTEQFEPKHVKKTNPENKAQKSLLVPVDSPIQLPTKSVIATSLIDMSLDTFRQGIILAEILGKPKGLHSRR